MLFFQGFLRSRGNGRGKSGLQGLENSRGEIREESRGECREMSRGKCREKSRGEGIGPGRAEGRAEGKAGKQRESRGESREVVGWEFDGQGLTKHQANYRRSVSGKPFARFPFFEIKSKRKHSYNILYHGIALYANIRDATPDGATTEKVV
jgi:hypothetical protein